MFGGVSSRDDDLGPSRIVSVVEERRGEKNKGKDERVRPRGNIAAQDEAQSESGGGDGGGAGDRERWARRVPSGRPDGEL